jgi:hypothetical protein
MKTVVFQILNIKTMGLDISVYKVLNPTSIDPQDDDLDFYVLSENPELSVFKDKLFERENKYYDLGGDLKKLGKDPNKVETLGVEYGNDVTYFFREDDIDFQIKNPSTIKKKEFCLAVDEVGYQRKGANKQFYQDGMWSSPCVVKKDTLLEHWEKYFSYQTPDSEGGFGSGVEYNQEDEEMKNNFKENIIDKFVEGETFVIYH